MSIVLRILAGKFHRCLSDHLLYHWYLFINIIRKYKYINIFVFIYASIYLFIYGC